MEEPNKIYFIYTQIGKQNNIFSFDINEKIKNIKELGKKMCEQYIQILYCIEILDSDNNKQVKISLIDNKGEYYYSYIHLNTLELLGQGNVDTNKFIIFNLKFLDTQKSEENKLEQFILPYYEQFYIFERNFKNNDEILINLYSSAIAQILLKTNQKFDFIIYIFFKIFDEEKYNNQPRLKESLKYFFQNMDKILLKSEYSQNMKIEKEKLNLLSNIDKIREKLIQLSVVKDENIDLFLSYYYIYYNKKLFIEFISNNKYGKSLTNTLKSHRNIFGNFTTEIINQELITQVEDLTQLASLITLYPSMVQFFKILSNKLIFTKLTNLKQLFRRAIDPSAFLKPNSNDDIDSLYKYFEEIYALFIKENIYPIILKENFFLDYYKCFEENDEDFHKNLMIIDMLTLYNSRISKKIDAKQILDLHFKKGISLLKKNKLKNENFMKFISAFPHMSNNEELIKYFPNGIEFKENNNNFNEDILNDTKYNLVKFLGENYKQIFEKIFKRFVQYRDLIPLKKWKLNDQTPIYIKTIFFETITRIWINDTRNNMYGFEDLFSTVFSMASLYHDNFVNIIKILEEKIAPEKLMDIYSRILLKNYLIKNKFKEHIIDFIRDYKKFSPIYIWYLMSTYDDKKNRIELLSKHLNSQFAVKYDDFVDYPKKINERILLFTKLKNYYYIPENFGDSEYYKNSMASKNELGKNIFKNAIKMNLQKILFLLHGFFVENEEDLYKIELNIINFRDKIEESEKYYESLKTIQKYFETFFINEKKELLDKLKNEINKFENKKLNDIDIESEKIVNKEILQFLSEAIEGNELINSIFFKEIYNNYIRFQEKEVLRYKVSLNKFGHLIKLGENNDLNSLEDDLKTIIINAAEKNENLLISELEFIKKYFRFGENDKYKNFNINILKNNIQYYIKRREGIDDINQINLMKEKENTILEVEDKVPEKIKNSEEKDRIKKNIEFLSNEIVYNLNTSEIGDKSKISDLFFNFYLNLYNIGINLAEFTFKEINNDIIYFANKLFYLAKNFGILDENPIYLYKNDILLLNEFNFMIQLLKIFNKEKISYINTFMIFKNIYNNIHNNYLHNEDIIELLDIIKDIIPKYGTNYIYIEILLINLETIISKKEIFKYILDKKYSFLFGDLFPILDNIFSEIIIEKLKFKKINEDDYFNFNSEIFNEVNHSYKNSGDDLGEMLFFYFESKIMNELNKNQEKNKRYIEDNFEHFLKYINFIERKFNYIKKEFDIISIIFSIAFVKCYVYLLISKYIQENDGYNNISNYELDYLFKELFIYKDIDNSQLYSFRTSIKLYILKLIVYYYGSFSEVRNHILYNFCLNEFESKLYLNDKNFGFYSIFIPLQLNTNKELYNSIIIKFFNSKNILDDEEIKKEMNNNIDILFCFFANFHFSNYCHKNYFYSLEYNNFKNYFLAIKEKAVKDNEMIEKLFLYLLDLNGKNIYKDFKNVTYSQI